jgi:hypothetical protein
MAQPYHRYVEWPSSRPCPSSDTRARVGCLAWPCERKRKTWFIFWPLIMCV